MVLVLSQRTRKKSLNLAAVYSPPDIRELVVFCPGCKTLETLWFKNGDLMQTRKFIQQGKYIFHDCGTAEPCRLYHSW